MREDVTLIIGGGHFMTHLRRERGHEREQDRGRRWGVRAARS